MPSEAKGNMATTKTSSEGDAKKVLCGNCKVVVTPTDKAMQCELCENWYHIVCQGVGEALYEELKADSENTDESQTHWYCKTPCNKVAGKFLGGMAMLQKQMEEISTGMAVIGNKVAEMESGNLPQGMVEAVKEITKRTQEESKDGDGRSAPGDGREENAKTTTQEHMAELEDRMRRKKNLIIFKVPEAKSQDSEARKKEDQATVHELLTELKSKAEPTDTRRLGMRHTQSNRPIRITLKDEEERDALLRDYHKARKQGTKMNNDDDAPWATKVAMRKDMTPLERKVEDDLFQELRAKREEAKQSGDDPLLWIRRSGKIVRVTKRLEPPTAQGLKGPSN